MNWYFTVFKKYFDFDGRARRKEYWVFTLINSIVCLILSLLIELNGSIFWSIISIIYGLGVFFPEWAVTVRRLHDTGHSGWWVFINLIPVIGAIILLIFLLTDSQEGANQYGPNPKDGSATPVIDNISF
jgi:uncharacterized membrane protein YhaH (DUF805 family)